MDVQRLKDISENTYTLLYNFDNCESIEFYKLHKKKIRDAYNKLKWYFNSMGQEARNGFNYLGPKEKIKVLRSRIKEAKDYFLDNSGVYEYEFLNYANMIEKKIIKIYRPFIEESPQFRKLLSGVNRKGNLKNKRYRRARIRESRQAKIKKYNLN